MSYNHSESLKTLSGADLRYLEIAAKHAPKDISVEHVLRLIEEVRKHRETYQWRDVEIELYSF
jgi:hypothetical protein